MKNLFRVVLVALFSIGALSSFSQDITLDSNKVNIFIKYLKYNHSFEAGGFEAWKDNNPDLYLKEMWYYSESFYVKRNYLNEGVTMNEGSIYIPRFEESRKENEESIVIIPGFRDVIVLIPSNQLIYKVK